MELYHKDPNPTPKLALGTQPLRGKSELRIWKVLSCTKSACIPQLVSKCKKFSTLKVLYVRPCP